MMQAVDERSYYRDLLQQSIPAWSWSDQQQHPPGPAAVPATMDFAYDGVFNTGSIPTHFNAFPSVLTQTLGEVDIDNSILHKLFEGLPEILEQAHSTHRTTGDSALGRPAATVASSPFFPFTPQRNVGRLSSMSGSVPDVTFMTAQNATPPATFLRPKPVSEHESEPTVRERWRRDDMAGKFLALESLLPPSTKRDRSTVVEDSMKLVKSLQHSKEEALKRRAELRLAALSPGMKLNRLMQKIGSLALVPMHGHTLGSRQESLSSSSLDRSATTGTKRPLEACITAPQDDTGQIPQALSDCVNRFYSTCSRSSRRAASSSR